jgi:hypothetical protein
MEQVNPQPSGLGPCPQGISWCRSQQQKDCCPVLDHGAVQIEWRWRHSDEIGAVIGVYGGAPLDACACLLANARGVIVDVLEGAPVSPAEMTDVVKFFVAYGIGTDRDVVLLVRSPARPAWLGN